MVDFKLLLNPPVAQSKGCIIRHRCMDVHKEMPCEDRRCIVNKQPEEQPSIQKKHCLIFAVIVAIIIVIVVLATSGAFNKQVKTEETLSPPNPLKRLPASSSILHVFDKEAVCSDNIVCSKIGREILAQNGTAVDATIATMVCNGMVTMQSMGLGGGFFMTIYIRDEKRAYALNAREKAPAKVKTELYKNSSQSQTGPLSIGVPGELRGLWAAHQRFGKLPWKSLLQPTIDLCESGYTVSKHQSVNLAQNKLAQVDPNIKEWLINSNGSFKAAGTKVVPKLFCETLRNISETDGNAFYNGSLSSVFLQDLKDVGSLIEKEDLENYQAEWMKPIGVTLNNGDSIYSAPPPASGVLLGFMMKILDGYNFANNSLDNVDTSVLTFHRMIEAFKFAYAKRTELGDPNFVNLTQLLTNLSSSEYADGIRNQIKDNFTSSDPKHYGAEFYSKGDHGTSHMSVLAPNGDAVSVTSSVNIYYGSGITSKHTGVILNSVMDDFSFPHFTNYFGLQGSPNNELKPSKRPLSSMAPSIVTNKNGDVKMVVGAAGGTRITSGIAQVIMRNSIFGQNIKEAVDAPRFHNQLYPNTTDYEYGVLQPEVDGLAKIGHNMKRVGALTVVCGISKNGNKITGNADHRKGGGVSGT